MFRHKKSNKLLFELIQIALGTKEKLSSTPNVEGWNLLYSEAMKQSVVGVAFVGVQRLPKEQWPPQTLLFEWVAISEKIKLQNLLVNKRCVEISKIFHEADFKSCILKGQGNGRLYSDSLSRTPGDIDIWVMPKNAQNDNRKSIDSFIHSKYPNEMGGRMHIQFPVFEDVPVEVHYIPRYMFSPWHNKRMQAFFIECADEQFNNKVCLEGAGGFCSVPTADFNLVQQLSHMMSHFMGEGIGLRQFVDYYYVLKNITEKKNEKIMLLKDMGLLKFARGVMWIERELLGLEDKYLITEPSEKIGRLILKKMNDGGNFGKFSKLNHIRHKNMAWRIIGGVCQSFVPLCYFPSEVIWKIIRKIY